MLDTIDDEAISILTEADWHWSDWGRCFEKGRNPEKQTTEDYRSHPPDQISYEDLQHNGLAGQASIGDQKAGLQWLRNRIEVPAAR